MSYKNVIKVNVNLSTKPTMPDDYYKFVYKKDYSSTLEAYKHSCELSLACDEVMGVVFLVLDNIEEALYLPTLHTYEDENGYPAFVTEHFVDFTKNLKLCGYRLCLWYSEVKDREVFEYNMKESLWKW